MMNTVDKIFLVNVVLPIKTGVLILILSLVFSFGQGQEDHQMIEIGTRADVLNNAKPSDFFKIPELKSKDGALEVHLFINKEQYNFGGTNVNLRSYTYKSGDAVSTSVGPWGPTLRIKPNDRLSVIVHNNLSEEDDLDFLGSMKSNSAISNILNKGGNVSELLKNILIKSTDSLIKLENLENAKIKVIKKDSLWDVYSKQKYPIKRMYNFGARQEGFRIYESKHHHGGKHDHNIPHGFNTTNLHTHGFHVSPFQDDIFRKVEAGFFSYYTYDLKNHTPGTMWYHPHVHGSTALQVASGMSGAIIIEEDNLDNFKDLAAASKPEHERVLIFNQVFFDTITGELPDFETLRRVRNPPKGTTINGVIVPKMKINPGEVQRWRLIHSGYDSTLALKFPEEAEVFQMSVDGIMFNAPREVNTIHMAPGNRTDILIKFDPGTKKSTYDVKSIDYNEFCEYFPSKQECQNVVSVQDKETIIKIILEGQGLNMNMPKKIPGPGKDLGDISDKELRNLGKPRKTEFNIARDEETGKFKFMVNNDVFKAGIINETLELNTAEEWLVSSAGGRHPYHIHINPFQVTKFGNLEVKPPIWKDVIIVNKNDEENINAQAYIRARYQEYWGDFVLHCHILHHEDRGMMQRIRIENPSLKDNAKVFNIKN